MKKIFKNLLALFVTGTMLAGVGCKDYDDDIDNLQKEVEDLKGQIALKADASALSALSQKFEAIDFDSFLTAADLADYVTKAELDEALASYLKTSELNSKVVEIVKTLGYQTKDDVLALIEGMMTKDDVLAIFKEQIAAGDTWNTLLPKVQEAIESALDEYAPEELTAGQKTQVENLITEAVKDKMDKAGVTTLIAEVLGTDFASYMEKYLKDNAETLAAGVNATVLAELKNAQSELAKQIETMISNGIGEDNVAYLQANDLKTKFEEYDKKIAAIWGAIEDLAGRIQSIVFVPTTSHNQDIDIFMGGYYIKADKDANNIQLASNPKVKMAFRVAPAALAENLASQINEGKVTASFIPEKVTRSEEAPVTYEGTVEAKDGKIIFTAVADGELYKELATKGETYAIALSLTQEAEKDAETGEYKTVGFEITSPYIITDGASEPVNDKFVLGYEDGNKYTEYNTVAAYELPWNSTETITMLGEYGLYYKDGNELITLAAAAEKYLWDEGVAESLTVKYKHTGITYQVQGAGADIYAKQTQLTVDPADVKANANVNKTVTVKNSAKQAITNVGDVLTLTDEAYVTNGTKTIALTNKDVTSTVTIMGDMLKTLRIDLDLVWKYSSYKNSYTYVTEVTIPAEDHVNWQKFNQLPDKFWANVNLPAGTNISSNGYGKVTIYFERQTMLNSESAQQFIVTAVNYVTGDGEYTYEVDQTLKNSPSYVKFVGNVTFKGLPAMNYKVENSTLASMNDNYTVTLDGKFNETLYEQVKDYFDNAGEVAEFIQGLNKDYSGVIQKGNATATPVVLDVTPNIENGTAFKLWFGSTGINWQKQDTYTYTVPTGENKGTIVGKTTTGWDEEVFKLNLTGSYDLTNTIYTLQPNNAYLYEGETNPYIYINGSVANDAFALENINLLNVYSATEEAVKSGAVQSFELVTKAPEGYGNNTLPEITTGTWTMKWNGCILDKVTVKAILKNAKGEVLDSKNFDVVLKAPITYDWTFFSGSEIEVSTIDAATFNLVNKVLALNGSGKAYTASKDDAVAIDIYGNELYKGTNGSYALTALASGDTGYDIEVTYGQVVWTDANETIDGVTVSNTGVITVPKGNEQLAKEIKGTVKVTYTYKYAWVPVTVNGKVTGYEREKFSFDIPVTFKNAPAIGE